MCMRAMDTINVNQCKWILNESKKWNVTMIKWNFAFFNKFGDQRYKQLYGYVHVAKDM